VAAQVNESVRQNHLEEGAEMQTARYNNVSAYLGGCPHQCSLYTARFVALVHGERIDA